MKITLSLFGKEETFLEEDLTNILEDYFSKEHNGRIKIKKPEKPNCEVPFKVDPQKINRSFFVNEREDCVQEEIRQLICEAFKKVDANPKEYGQPFETLRISREEIEFMSEAKFADFASELGGHIANWVEQALEWAQRIQNGESWQELCNYSDNTRQRRLIIWQDGQLRTVGGTYFKNRPATYVSSNSYCSGYWRRNRNYEIALLIVRKEKVNQ